MSEPLREGSLPSEGQDDTSKSPNHAWVDIASALESVSPPAEEEATSRRVSMLSDVREALKAQILEHLYEQVLDELGPPEQLVQHVLSTYAEEIGETLEEARGAFSEEIKRRVLQSAKSELNNADRMAQNAASEVDSRQLAPIKRGVVSRLHQQVLDDAVQELRQEVLGEETNLVGSMFGAMEASAPSPTKKKSSSPPSKEPFENWADKHDNTPAPAPPSASGPSTRELRVQLHFDVEPLQKKMQAIDQLLEEVFSEENLEQARSGQPHLQLLSSIFHPLSSALLPDLMESTLQEDMPLDVDQDAEVVARHVSERCHRALLKHAEGFLANQVDLDEQSVPELLVLDTLYYVPEDNAVAFRAEAEHLNQQFAELGFQIELNERRGVSL